MENEEVWYLKNCNAQIRGNLCGTANEKSVWVKVNCEMGIDGAYNLAAAIIKAIKFVKKNEKDCSLCPGKIICPKSPEYDERVLKED